MMREGERLAAIYMQDIAEDAKAKGLTGAAYLEKLAMLMLPEDADVQPLELRDTAERHLVSAFVNDADMKVLLAQDKMWPGGGLLNHVINTLGVSQGMQQARRSIDISDPGIQAILELAKADQDSKRMDEIEQIFGRPDKPGRGR